MLVIRELTRSVVGRSTSRAALRVLLDRRRLRETPGPHSIAAPVVPPLPRVSPEESAPVVARTGVRTR
jgi:hypothetical protein